MTEETKEPIDWKDSETLEEWLLKQFALGRAKSPEVQAMADVLGRARFRKLYIDWKAAQGPKKEK